MTTDPGRSGARPDLRLRHDRLRRRAVGPALDHDRHLARAARARAAAAAHGDIPLLRAPGRRARARRRFRLQAQAEQEGRGGRRDRPARHAQVDRERRAAGRGGARRPAGDRQQDHAGTGPFVVEATIPTPVDFDGDGVEDSGVPDDGSYVDRMLEALRRNPSLQLGGNADDQLRTSGRRRQSLTLSAEAQLEPDDAAGRDRVRPGERRGQREARLRGRARGAPARATSSCS